MVPIKVGLLHLLSFEFGQSVTAITAGQMLLGHDRSHRQSIPTVTSRGAME